MKPGNSLIERRRYIRLKLPIEIGYIANEGSSITKTATKDISADGLRFETHDKSVNESNILELKLNIPGTANPIHAKGRIAWKKKITLDDSAPYNIGVEFIEIEEDNKNTFLKFLCDLLYAL